MIYAQVSVYFHVQLTESNKQMSLNVADLGISTSSFFNLDDTTSWVSIHGVCLVEQLSCGSGI